jgi:hypothetical protein
MKINPNSITFCSIGPKLVEEQNSHQVVKGFLDFPAVPNAEQVLHDLEGLRCAHIFNFSKKHRS